MAITIVNATTLNAASGSIASTTAGNCLVVCVSSQTGSGAGAGSVSGITIGGAADNFSSLVSLNTNDTSGNNAAAIIWSDPNCAGGQTALAITGSHLGLASGTGQVRVFEVAGLVSASVLDKSDNSGSGFGGGWTTANSSPTTTQATEIWIGCVQDANTSPSVTSTGWTNTIAAHSIAGYKIVSATGTLAYTGSDTNAGLAWSAVVVALKGSLVTPNFSQSKNINQSVMRAAIW